jgi:predicted AAA+ superfamily ATPase
MNQKDIDKLIKIVGKLKEFSEKFNLSVTDLSVINDYVGGEMDYDGFVSYFNAKAGVNRR